MNTIEEAKEHLRANWEKGVQCPCCGQLVRRWKHSLNTSLARTLIEMHKIRVKENREFVHIMREIHLTTMYGILAYWKLIEPREHFITDDHKKASGEWRLTEKGTDFVQMGVLLPKYVYIFNDKIDGFSEEQTNIKGCLGKKFNYEELIRS